MFVKIKNFCFKLGNKFYFPGLGKRIFNGLNVSKVLIIFIFGFVSRVLVNNIYEINVFIEYTEIISLVYYGIMALFTVLVSECVTYCNFNIVPSILIDSLFLCFSKVNLVFFKFFSVVKLVVFKIFKLILISEKEKDTILFMNRSNKDFIGYPGTSAAHQGLVGHPVNNRGRGSAAISGLYDGSRSGRNHLDEGLSITYRLKRRLFWYSWKQFSDKYNSFEEFKRNWDPQLSVRKEIKNDLKKLLKK